MSLMDYTGKPAQTGAGQIVTTLESAGALFQPGRAREYPVEFCLNPELMPT